MMCEASPMLSELSEKDEHFFIDFQIFMVSMKWDNCKSMLIRENHVTVMEKLNDIDLVYTLLCF